MSLVDDPTRTAPRRRGTPVVEAADVTRTLGGRVVLDGVDLALAAGEVVGVIGRNGAGKTTLVECLVGVQPVTAGSVRVLGVDPVRHRGYVTRRVAVQAQAAALLPALTVLETLDLFASLYARHRPVTGLLDLLGLDGLRAQRVGRLSGGEARRLQIALALLPYADVVVLDEPSAAVDPHGRTLVERAIRALAGQGVAVLLTTHDMTEAEQWCDRVVVLDSGRVAAVGAPADLIAQHHGRATVAFSVEVAGGFDALRAAAAPDDVDIEEARAGTEAGTRRARIDTDDVDALVRRLTFARGVRTSGLSIERRGLAALYFDD